MLQNLTLIFICSGDLNSGLVWILNDQNQVGLQMVQILTGSLNPEDQSFKIRTKAIAISIAKPNI